MENVIFVILHYNEMDVTQQCIETIISRTSNYEVKIVVVDNCSPDGSGKKLQKYYKNDDMVTVLLLDENLGFAKGNNIGYQYARKNLHSEFICVLNNDVLLLQDDFLNLAVNEFVNSKCGVIGPHITLKNSAVNYMYMTLFEKKVYEKELNHSVRMYKYYTSKLFCIRNVINRLIDMIVKSKQNDEQDSKMLWESQQRWENIVLHGCCLIFTPIYVRKYQDAFNPKTFMFREEELLYIRCKDGNVKMVYNPLLNVLHLEDVSTNSSYKSIRTREAFKWKCQIESLQILLEEM